VDQKPKEAAMFRTLLVPLDGTPFGEHALPLALSVARCSRAAVHLVRVHIPTLDLNDRPLVSDERDRRERSQEQAYLDGVARRLQQHAPGVGIVARLVDGAEHESLAAALIKHAGEIHADLFALSGHYRTGVSRWLFGNVADDLLHQTMLPLLLVPASVKEPTWDPAPAFRHILVALDGSPLAERMLETVLSLAGCMGAALTLLRVVEPALVPVIDPAFTAAAVELAALESQQQSAREYLDHVAGRLRAAPHAPVVRTQVALDAQAAAAILGYVKMAHTDVGPVDLIALATHARTGLGRLLLGSVADRVARRAPVPLLLQHPAD
jgi:nucleotide-binding universal stress UspA family protein